MQPTVLIGLDGATFTVLEPLLAEGHMPFLKSFLADGVRGELLSTPHPLTPPAWTTMLTGRTPGNHGVYDFVRGEVRGNAAFFTLTNFRDIQCETVWTLVSRWGGRVMALNFPLTAPPPVVHGVMVPGLLSWKHLRRNVYPPELFDELKRVPGFDAREVTSEPEMVTAALNMSEEELTPWLRHHALARDCQWQNVCRHLMQSDSFDLTTVMFAGVDKIQHVCWRFLDPELLPKQMNAVEQTLRDLCLEYFRAVDNFVREIVQQAGPQANVFITSDHGFGPTWKSFRVNKWLEQQGYLRWPKQTEDGRSRKNSHFVHLDWEHTLAYTPSAPTNGIWIRVQEKPGGPGVPPEQYPAFRDRLIEQLRAVRDPESGRPFFKDILKREDAFPGVHMGKAPDLTLVPFDHGFVSVLDHEPIVADRAAVWGTHYPAGIVLAHGPAMAKGQAVPQQSIVDIAPTLLHSLGLPIPSDYEGRVIEALFDPAFLREHPIKQGPPTEPPDTYAVAPTRDAESAEEDETVLTRLRDLGYVE